MGNEENTPEKGSAGKSATLAGVAMAMIGLCSIVAKGIFDHFDDLKPLLAPKAAAVASPTPGPQTEQTPPAKSVESPTPTRAAHATLVKEDLDSTGSPAPGPGSVGLPAGEGRAPVGVVRGYYDAINRRSLPGAYDRLSVGFRTRRSLPDFGKMFADTASVAIQQIRQVSQNGETATVFIVLRETDSDHREWDWQGNVYLVREQAGWRIERTDLKKI